MAAVTTFKPGERVEAICKFDGSAGADGLLTFEQDEVITFSRADPSGWAHGSIGSRSGWFPLQYVRAFIPPPAALPPPKPPLPPGLVFVKQKASLDLIEAQQQQPAVPAPTQSRRASRPQSMLGDQPTSSSDLIESSRTHSLASRKAITSLIGSDVSGLIAATMRNSSSSEVVRQSSSPAASLSRGSPATPPYPASPTSSASSLSSLSSPSISPSPAPLPPPYSPSSPSSSSSSSSLPSSSSSSSSVGARSRGDSLAMVEIRQLAASEEPSTESVDHASITKKKGRTAVMLGTWLKTKRPTAEEMTQQGLLSTGGSLDSAKVKRSKEGIFGMELEELLESVPGRPIPIIVDQCITYIRTYAMQTPGIFRVSPNNAELQSVRKLYKSPIEVIDLKKKTTSPHTVAALLKLWLQLLPEPLLSFQCYSDLMDLFRNVPAEARMRHISVFLNQLNQQRRPIVTFLFQFLHELSQNSETNKMTPSNLGIVFGPNLLKPKVQDQSTMLDRTNVEIVEFLVEHFREWIDGIKP